MFTEQWPDQDGGQPRAPPTPLLRSAKVFKWKKEPTCDFRLVYNDMSPELHLCSGEGDAVHEVLFYHIDTDFSNQQKIKRMVRQGGALHHSRGGGGGFGGVPLEWGGVNRVGNFTFQISCNVSPTKPVAKLHRACKALHTTSFLGVSAKFPTQIRGLP